MVIVLMCLNLEQVVFRRYVCLSISVVAPANQLGRFHQYSTCVRFSSGYRLQPVQWSLCSLIVRLRYGIQQNIKAENGSIHALMKSYTKVK